VCVCVCVSLFLSLALSLSLCVSVDARSFPIHFHFLPLLPSCLCGCGCSLTNIHNARARARTHTHTHTHTQHIIYVYISQKFEQECEYLRGLHQTVVEKESRGAGVGEGGRGGAEGGAEAREWGVARGGQWRDKDTGGDSDMVATLQKILAEREITILAQREEIDTLRAAEEEWIHAIKEAQAA